MMVPSPSFVSRNQDRLSWTSVSPSGSIGTRSQVNLRSLDTPNLGPFSSARRGPALFPLVQINGSNMTKEGLKNSAKFYANIYKNDHLLRATVSFDDERGHLIASYFFDHVPSDNDKEECELFCGEIVGVFPEIRTAETVCVMDGDAEAELRPNCIIAFSR